MARRPWVSVSRRRLSQSRDGAGWRRTRHDTHPARDFLSARHVVLGHRCEGRTIGTAGAPVTIQRHGVAFFRGITARKGWHGRHPVSLRADLAAGRVDALLAA
jgi:hypothetical protein